MPVTRVVADADRASRHDELFGTAVRRESLAQSRDVDARDEEVCVLRVDAEQLVADRAADDIRVELERADVLLDLLRRLRSPRSRRATRMGASRPRRLP